MVKGHRDYLPCISQAYKEPNSTLVCFSNEY